MKRAIASLLLILLTAAGLAGAALAQVAPYSDWRFRLDRAGTDPAKIAAVGKESLAFTRAWFYGHVFDLSIAGIAEKEKRTIRARAAIFADVLADADPPDLRPALVLELPVEQLRADFDAMEGVLNAALNSDRPVDRVAQVINELPHALIAHAAFYALLHRADVANPRLGGRYDAGRRLEAARGLAEVLAFADGDLEPWRALAGFRGEDAVRPDPPTIPESRICEAINQIGSDQPATGRAAVLDGRRAISDAGAPPLRLALVGLGPALIAERSGDHPGARGALSAGSRSGPQWIRHVLTRRALAAAVSARDPAGARGLAEALGRLGEGKRADPRDDAILIAAVDLWRATGAAQEAAGKLDAAAEEIAAAQTWTQWLRRPDRLAGTVPEARRQAARERRAALAAEVALAGGHLALRLGQETAAAQAFRVSQSLFLEARRPVRAAAAELALAEVLLRTGDLDQSLARASDGIQAIQTDPVGAARGFLVRGRIRLRRGELAPAFANANTGLDVLRAAGQDLRPLRIELHALAAAALDADGQRVAAAARLAFARKIEDGPAIALLHATALAEAGDLAGAAAAVQPHAGDPEAAVALGCLEARAGQPGPAAARLAPLLPALSPDLDLEVRARACLAMAWTALGQKRQAQALLLPPEAMRAADPAEAWALLAAVALADAAQVDLLREAAIESWRRARGDGHLLTLLDRRPQALADLGPLIDGWIAEDLGRRAPNWQVSLPLTVWWSAARRAATSAAPRPDLDLPGEALRALRGPLLNARAARATIADPALTPAQRTAAMTRRAAAWADAATAVDAALAAHPRWAAYAAPLRTSAVQLKPSAGVARLYLQTGPARSRSWLFRPGAKAPVSADLPGRDVLASLRAGIEAHLLSGAVFPEGGADPHRAAWRQLAEAGRTLAPQLVKQPEATAVERLEVIGDGPLELFPWSALVLAEPTRSGPAPAFLGARWTVVHRLGLTSRQVDPPLAPALSLAAADPLPAPLQALSDRLAARQGTVDRHPALAITRPLAHVHGIFEGSTVTLGASRHDLSAVARLKAEAFDLALSGELDAPVGPLLGAWAHAGARTIVVPVGAGAAPPGPLLLDAWSRVIGKAPVDELVFSRTDRGGALTARASVGTSTAVGLAAGLSATRRAFARQAGAPGAVPAHHPSQWARWVIVQP